MTSPTGVASECGRAGSDLPPRQRTLVVECVRQGRSFRDEKVDRLCCEVSQAAVGMLALSTRKPWAIDKTYFGPSERPLYLTSMAVAPDQQRKGIGRLCLHEHARSPGDGRATVYGWMPTTLLPAAANSTRSAAFEKLAGRCIGTIRSSTLKCTLSLSRDLVVLLESDETDPRKTGAVMSLGPEERASEPVPVGCR